MLASPLLSAVPGPAWVDHLLNLGLVGLFGSTLWLSLAIANGALGGGAHVTASSTLILEKHCSSGRFSTCKVLV